VAIEFWFRTTSGDWWYWPSLPPNNWNLSGWVHDVDRVQIRAARGSSFSYTIQDFDILD
jgi:hypothetical protein